MLKRIITITLCFSMIFAMFIGCKESVEKKPEMQKVTHVYKSDFIEIPENININGSTLTFSDDGKVYILGEEVIDRETWVTNPIIYSFDLNGENPEIEYIDNDDIVNNETVRTYINNFAITSNGEMIFSIYRYNMDDQNQERLLNIYDSDNNLISSVDPKQYFDTKRDMSRYGGMGMDEDYFYLSHMKIGNDDVIYLGTDNAVAAVTLDGTKLYEIEVDTYYMSNLITTNDGKVIILYQDKETYSEVFQYIDTQKKALGEIIELPIGRNQNSSIYAGTGFDVYYKDDTAIYGYNMNDEDPIMLMNMINSDVNPNNINGLNIIDKDKFLLMEYDYVTNQQQFVILTKIPDDEVPIKKIISLAYLYADKYTLMPAVVNFNRRSDEYRIIITDYSKFNTEEDYSLGQTKFNTDIMSDSIPDIMILAYDMSHQDYTSKGLFADLYEFMNKDSEFKKDNIIPCVINAYEVDGKLYQIPTNISVGTLVGKSSIVGEKAGWTISEMMELIEKHPDSYLTTNINKMSMFQLLMSLGISDFVDYEKATCNFDSPEFISMLNYINQFNDKSFYETLPEDARNEFWQNQNEYIMNDTILLKEYYLSSFSDYLQLKSNFNNEDLTFKGYPSSSSNGAMIASNELYAISDKSLYKDGAWEFMKYMLSDEVLTSDRYSHRGIPVTESGFYAAAENVKKFHYYFNENGMGYSMSESAIDSAGESSMGNDIHMQLTDEDVTFIKNYIDGITMTYSIDNKLLKIIQDDIEMFIAGEKSAEETAKVIQSRALIYISENA